MYTILECGKFVMKSHAASTTSSIKEFPIGPHSLSAQYHREQGRYSNAPGNEKIPLASLKGEMIDRPTSFDGVTNIQVRMNEGRASTTVWFIEHGNAVAATISALSTKRVLPRQAVGQSDCNMSSRCPNWQLPSMRIAQDERCHAFTFLVTLEDFQGKHLHPTVIPTLDRFRPETFERSFIRHFLP